MKMLEGRFRITFASKNPTVEKGEDVHCRAEKRNGRGTEKSEERKRGKGNRSVRRTEKFEERSRGTGKRSGQEEQKRTLPDAPTKLS